jgi:hypothetical protein
MDTAGAAELKTLLVGVPLPAERSTLVAYAARERADARFLDALRRIPRREYPSLDEVVEELVGVQPDRRTSEPRGPHEESGAPPGRRAYTSR